MASSKKSGPRSGANTHPSRTDTKKASPKAGATRARRASKPAVAQAPSATKTPTREMLAAWVQTPPRVGSTFAAELSAEGDLEVFRGKLEGVGSAVWSIVDAQDPPTGTELQLVGKTPGRRVAWVLRRLEASWSLEAYFRETGTLWGSNQAEWLRFKTEALQALGATPLGADRIW